MSRITNHISFATMSKFLIVFVLLLIVDKIHAQGSVIIPRRFRRPRGIRGAQPRRLKEKREKEEKKHKKGDYYFEGDFDSMLHHSSSGKHLTDFFQNVVKEEVSGQVNEHLSKMEEAFGLVGNETAVVQQIIEVSSSTSTDGLNSTARP